MKLVVDNDAAEIERRRAAREEEQARAVAQQAAQELAANLIRIARGAGSPHYVLSQTFDLAKAIQDFAEVAPTGLGTLDFAGALHISRDWEELQTYSEVERERARAEEAMIRGALQVAASRILGQRTQESRGKTEMWEGFYALERWREERRKVRVEQEKAARPTKPKRPRG